MRLALLGLFGGLALVLAGGGPSLHTVSGTVTFKGEPVPEGNIAFLPDGGPGTGTSGPISKGEYSVRAPAGKYKVEITASKMMPLPRGQTGMDGAKEEVQQYIPDRYNVKTELKADVPGQNPHNFTLEEK